LLVTIVATFEPLYRFVPTRAVADVAMPEGGKDRLKQRTR
jgi:hypothetical protein